MVAVDSAVCGFATHDADPAGAALVTVAVHPSHQGAGLGRRLVAAVEARARAAGAPTLSLYTNAAMVENVPFYEGLGFRVTGRVHEDGFDRITFQKALAPAAVVRAGVGGLYGRRRSQSPGSVRADGRLVAPDAVPDALGEGPARMEIGFGGGEHLIAHATMAPDVAIVGVEPFETGLARAMREAEAALLTNLVFVQGDAADVLDALPDGRLSRVDLLYPDPWHKQRHWKRRFVSAQNLARLARVMAPGATLRFASDIEAYVRWTRAHIAAADAFSLEGDAPEPWAGWPGTRYEAKALREGRTPRYLTIVRAARHRADARV